MLGLKRLYVKRDDGQNPTASLEGSRQRAWRVGQGTGSRERRSSPAPPTGNAASSLAGNAAAAGLRTFIFVPERAPKGKVAQLMTSAPM